MGLRYLFKKQCLLVGKMNQDWKIINDNKRDLFRKVSQINTFDVDRGASLEHELKRAEVYVRLRYEGRAVWDRPVLKNGKIPDLVVADIPGGFGYEIMLSETQERFEKKNYPLSKVVQVKVDVMSSHRLKSEVSNDDL